MRADRLIAILLLLHSHERLTTRDLAQRLEVSPRTIHRDIEALCAAGVPIYAERGRLGGWRLSEGYQATPPALTTAETSTLFIAGAAGLLSDLGMDNTLQTALLKLSAWLPESDREAVEHILQRIHIEPGNWFRNANPLPHLSTLQQAVLQDRVVEIVYTRSDGSLTERRIEPYGLIAKAGVWYMLAQTDQGRRMFRVGRVQSALLTDDTFKRPPDFDLAHAWNEARATFENRFRNYTITLRVPAALLPIVNKVYGTDVPVGPRDADGRLELRLSFESFETACFFVLGCGPGVVVVEPEDLRLAVLEALHKLLSQYAQALHASRVQ
ncbi:MAG: YafY family transcriptional regulator [Chloroflexaceae bacterium]|nr:YafY family transcriptional regulator [Chloroflexaceae bacterium]